MNKRTFFLVLPILSIILFIYRAWFFSRDIIGGDWPYYWRDSLLEMRIWPSLWVQWQGNGLGGTNPLLGLRLFQSLLIVPFTQWLGIPWNIVYKAGWFGLSLTLSFISPIVLWRSIFPRVSSWWPAFLAGLIYSTNTYILLVTGGGQMGVAIVYALAPLVLAAFIRLIGHMYSPRVNIRYQISDIRYSLIAGLLLGIQLMIDPRIAYVTMVGVGIYFLFNLKSQILKLKPAVFILTSFVVAVLLNAFWVVPMVMMKSNPLESLGSAYTSIDSIKFFSFADFSHALSLLHPNWPENLFGKSYFLQPEFLVLPLLAFSSLLYWRKEKFILFFVFLGLIGVFLSKGAQEPFGSVYQWMFTHVPGFVMFRDPTKFYVLIALAYSVLIPFTLKQLTELRMRGKTLPSTQMPRSLERGLNDRRVAKYPNAPTVRSWVLGLLITLFILFWLFTTREAALGKLGGTFVKHSVPEEYRDLERFLQAQPGFSRTLWVPRQQRFSYGTLDHMPVEAEPLLGATTAAELKMKLDEPVSKDFLTDLGIGYVMIPYDSLGELFLTDRKYDEKKRQEYETVLDGVEWLTKIRSGNLTIYQAPSHRDIFWLSGNSSLIYRRIRPDKYAVSFSVREAATLYFSQTFHPGWVMKAGSTIVKSRQSPLGVNSFQIQGPGTYEGVIEFEPQKYVTWGMAVSLLTVLGVVLAFMI